MLKRIFKFINELRSRRGPSDRLRLGEEVIISLVKDGETLKVIRSPGHTWTSTGLNFIRNWLIEEGTKIPPNSFTTNGSPASTISANAYNPGVSNVAGWKGTFGSSGAISGISTIRLMADQYTLSNYSVTSFTKPDGVELRLDWRTTITAG